MVKPLRIKHGDLIGIIAPAGPVEAISLNRGTAYIEQQGLRIRTGRHVFLRDGYLAGTDDQRLDDLQSMFLDQEVKAIMLARGGYGTGRLLDKIDYSIIRKNPKVFVGYSDASFLQWAMLRKAGLITISGPMVASDFGAEKINEKSAARFWSLLFGKDEIRELISHASDTIEILNPGKAEGPVICGCLSVIASLLGTQYCPDLNNAILILEDVGEEPYRLDRLITSMKLHDVFRKISGLVLGRFTHCEAADPRDKHITIREIVLPIVKEYSIPALMNIPFGHIPEKITVPLGINAELNAGNKSLRLTDIPLR